MLLKYTRLKFLCIMCHLLFCCPCMVGYCIVGNFVKCLWWLSCGNKVDIDKEENHHQPSSSKTLLHVNPNTSFNV